MMMIMFSVFRFPFSVFRRHRHLLLEFTIIMCPCGFLCICSANAIFSLGIGCKKQVNCLSL